VCGHAKQKCYHVQQVRFWAVQQQRAKQGEKEVKQGENPTALLKAANHKKEET